MLSGFGTCKHNLPSFSIYLCTQDNIIYPPSLFILLHFSILDHNITKIHCIFFFGKARYDIVRYDMIARYKKNK